MTNDYSLLRPFDAEAVKAVDMKPSEVDGGRSHSTVGLGIWLRTRPLMFHLCTLDVYQTDRPLNKGVWEIIGFEDMDSEQEVFILRRFSPAEPNGPTEEEYRAWRGLYEAGHMHIWRRGPDMLDPRFLMPNAALTGAEGVRVECTVIHGV